MIRVQDTGGQLIFLGLLELLHSPKASVCMIVFSLAKLEATVATEAQLPRARPRMRTDRF